MQAMSMITNLANIGFLVEIRIYGQCQLEIPFRCMYGFKVVSFYETSVGRHYDSITCYCCDEIMSSLNMMTIGPPSLARVFLPSFFFTDGHLFPNGQV